jgi:hypothetical protein
MGHKFPTLKNVPIDHVGLRIDMNSKSLTSVEDCFRPRFSFLYICRPGREPNKHQELPSPPPPPPPRENQRRKGEAAKGHLSTHLDLAAMFVKDAWRTVSTTSPAAVDWWSSRWQVRGACLGFPSTFLADVSYALE